MPATKTMLASRHQPPSSTPRKCLLAAIALGGVLVARDASAIELGTPAQAHPFRSAQNFALEIRVSPYYPAVDDEPGLRGTPFKDRFGDNPRIALGLEFDWQTFRIPYVGTIGPGIGASIVNMSRPAVTVSGRASGDEYGLSIYPMYLSAVLRADTFWRGLGFPLVPYAKLGLAVGFWRATNAAGTSDSILPGETQAVPGRGMSFGTHMAGGLAFPLDALDSGASRNMDNFLGINNTYIYGEYYWLNLNGLGQSSALYVGTTTWAAGLAFEF
ncbi:MAG: hypothetical protein KF764_11725 [Labilithrix sp.]|nr:hypothetical protein [Labilithrix sp.]